MATATKKKNKPVQTFRYGVSGGAIEVSVWETPMKGDHGDFTLYSISQHRSFKDGDEWKQTSSMRTNDIPVLQYALSQAYGWIMEQKNPNTPID